MTTAGQRSEARSETVLRETRTVDSVFIHDSIVIREGGDTIIRERWRTCWRNRIVHDTVIERSTDTILETQFVEKVVEVPAKGTGYGWIAALTLLAIIVIYIFFKTH